MFEGSHLRESLRMSRMIWIAAMPKVISNMLNETACAQNQVAPKNIHHRQSTRLDRTLDHRPNQRTSAPRIESRRSKLAVSRSTLSCF